MAYNKTISDKLTPPPTKGSKEEIRVGIEVERVENPGRGNCAFYAFAIGLINIIQYESAANKKENAPMFNRWLALDPSINDLYQRICEFDSEKRDNELLDTLQMSLRKITYQYKLNELRRVCASSREDNGYKDLVATSSFINFSAIYYDVAANKDPHYNEYADSKPIKEALTLDEHSTLENPTLNNMPILEGYEHIVFAQLMMRLIYGKDVAIESITETTEPKKDSPIIKAMQSITKDTFWGNHLDLDYLANAFVVNLHTLENGEVMRKEKGDVPERHTIIVNNEGNAHWTTLVPTAILSPSEKMDVSSIASSKVATTGIKSKPIDEFQIGNSPTLTKKESDSTLKPGLGKTPELPGKAPPKRLEEKGTHSPSVSDLGNAPVLPGNPTPVVSQENVVKPKITPSTPKLGGDGDNLKTLVQAAVLTYTIHTNGIWFSFFHRHAGAGIKRAEDFETLIKSKDNSEVRGEIIKYLENKKNGNTHPHSFRTMLLRELLNQKESLEEISSDFDGYLSDFKDPSSSKEYQYF